MKNNTPIVTGILLGLALLIGLVVVLDYAGILDLIDTSEPPLPLFVAMLMLITMSLVLRKRARSEKD